MPDLGFLGWDLKIILSYFKPTLSNLSNCKICEKTKKKLNLGPKMPYLVIIMLKFQNYFVMFEINALKFVLLQNIMK